MEMVRFVVGSDARRSDSLSLRTPPIYTRTALVLIKDDSKGQSVSDMESFSNLGLFQSNTNVNNELIALKSPALMTEVVKRLNLDMNYYVPGRFHKQVAYGQTLPATVVMADFPENETANFTLRIEPDSTISLSEFVRNGEDLDSEKVTGRLFDTVPTPSEPLLWNRPSTSRRTSPIPYTSIVQLSIVR